MMLFAAVLVAFFACVTPQCTPDQWEGYEGSIGGYAKRGYELNGEKSGHGLIEEFVSIHYDYTHKRTAVFLDYVNNDYRNKFQIVVLGEKERVYVVNEEEGSCWSKKMKEPFRRICIPEGVKPSKAYYMGLYGTYKVTAYEIEKYGMKSYLTVQTKGKDIVPVGESVVGRLGSVDFVQSIGFVDIEEGVKNASVFDVPEACKPKEDMSLALGLSREHFILAL